MFTGAVTVNSPAAIAAVILLRVYLAVAVYLNIKLRGQCVYYRKPYAVKTAGYFVSARRPNLPPACSTVSATSTAGLSIFFMNIYRNAPAVILYGAGTVLMNCDHDVIAKSSKASSIELSSQFLYQMMQAPFIRRAYVHARSAAHSLQPLQNLDL